MADFALVQKPSFLHDLLAMRRDVQQKVVSAVERIQIDPFRSGGKAKKLFTRRYKNLYRYRIGDHRIVYAVGTGCVSILAVGPRQDIYDRFSGDAHRAVDIDVDLSSAEPIAIETAVGDAPVSISPPQSGDMFIEAEDDDPPGDESMVTSAELLRGLLSEWGIADHHHDAVLGCRTPEQIFDLKVPDEVKERILHWHRPPAAQQIIEQPTLELPSASDLQRFLDGTLKGFLLKLDPDQERVVDRNRTGPVLVKGGPGTGKSVVALYRIRRLFDGVPRGKEPSVLFLTYTTSLRRVTEQLLDGLLGDVASKVVVSTLDKIVYAIATAKDGEFRPANHDQKIEALRSARRTFVPPGGPMVQEALRDRIERLDDEYLIDEFDWVIEGRGITSVDEYLSESRTGRGVALDKRVRSAVWNLYACYRDGLQRSGVRTWDVYRTDVLEALHDDPSLHRQFDYVFVDEAQDLTPVGLRLCVALSKKSTGIYMTADACQSIYNRGFAWSSVHDDLRFRGRSSVLKRNYRSTRQIAAAARQLISINADPDVETQETVAVREGVPPVLHAVRGDRNEINSIAVFLRRSAEDVRLPVWSGAVLARSNRAAKEIAEGLAERGLPAKWVKGDQIDIEGKFVTTMTIHSAKGLEFPFVAVARVDDGAFPHIPRNAGEEEAAEAVLEERRLFYVALTRACRRLSVFYDADRPSRFIRDLDRSLWVVE
jgi:superfamily I DNA/RNA helicase/mRNA-degrading endonuclease RelE of RelBE toxin-antitoxin system